MIRSWKTRQGKIPFAWQEDNPEGCGDHHSCPPFPGAKAPMFNSWEGDSVPHCCRNGIHITSRHKKIHSFETEQPPVAFYCLKPIHLEHDYLIISQTGQTQISFMT